MYAILTAVQKDGGDSTERAKQREYFDEAFVEESLKVDCFSGNSFAFVAGECGDSATPHRKRKSFGQFRKKIEPVSIAGDVTVVGTPGYDENGNVVVNWALCSATKPADNLVAGAFDTESAFLTAYCNKCESRADKSRDGKILGAASKRKSDFMRAGKKIWAAHLEVVQAAIEAEKQLEVEKTLRAGLPLESLFGIKLGEKVDVADFPKTGNGEAYLFTPPKRFRNFSVYSFRVTPSSHAVYQIQAVSQVDVGVKVGEEMLAVKNALMKKFEKKAVREIDRGAGYEMVFPCDDSEAERRVVVRRIKGGISITAVDLGLQKRAEEEKSSARSRVADEDVDAL